ncbi:MAG: acyl-CoA dehydrogenase family protein [Burkholderiaceae bacterium]|nr:acyl-CoA dehydrogenase family protein [Burkholderiaceae bacterium]
MDPILERDDTQALMQDSLARWLDDNAPFERRAALLASPEAIAPLWRGLSQELGLLGAALPEALGGQGGALAEHLLIAQALGHALLPEPYLACAVSGAGLLLQLGGERSRQLLAGVADGAVRPVLAALEPAARHDLTQVDSCLGGAGDALRLSGRKAVVRAAPCATHWLVSARDAAGTLRVALVDPGAAGVSRRDLRLADGSWGAELGFDATPVVALLGDGDALPAIEHAVDITQLASGAEAVGVMQRLLRETLDYVRQRKQFGVPLSSFQVLQHRLADMHMALQLARALVGATLSQVDAPAAQRRRAVASAQVAVARAAKAVGQGAVQLHGGMGMTDELSVGHGFKRLTLIEQLMGGVDVHLRQVARLSALAAEC